MAGYTRVDTINNIADGNVINAADLDGEFDGIQAAFNSSTGHNHDGTAGEGAPILALGPVQDVTISTTVLGVKTTNTVDLGTTGLRFKDFYLAGAASIGTLSVTGNTTIGDADTDTITQAASYVTGTQLKSAKTATNTLNLAAYDVDGTAYTNLITLTASNTPTLTLTSTGVGTINNMSIGATTASTGAFTTLSSTGNTTLGDASADAITVNGTTTFNASPIISVTDNTNAALRITQLGTGNALLVEDSSNPDATPFVIDASGNAIQGYTSLLSFTAPAGTLTPTIQSISQASSLSQGISSTTHVSSANGPNIVLGKSRGASASSPTIVSSGDTSGNLIFNGYDGATYLPTAYIQSIVDGTPGLNDMPGRLVFSTTADGASTPTEAMRITSGQLVSIGTTQNAQSKLYVTNTVTDTASAEQGVWSILTANNASGGPTKSGMRSRVTVGASYAGTGVLTGFLSEATNSLTTTLGGSIQGFRTSFTNSSTGTIPAIYSFSSTPPSNASGTITNFYGFSQDDVTTATNVYGYLGAVTSGANKWNLYMSGTANNYMAGSLGIGSATLTQFGLRISKSITGNVNSYGVYTDSTVQSDVTTSAAMYASNPNTQATTFTLGALRHFQSVQGTFGAGSTVTNQFGFFADSTLTGATNNYGFYGNIASGSNRYNLYMAGTADNYMAGRLGIGTTGVTDSLVPCAINPTGATTMYGFRQLGTIQSDVTSSWVAYQSIPATQAAAFTLASLQHFRAAQGTIGAGSAITNQFGYVADVTLTGATNNYGFFGNIASGTGRWNFYANGTADNYFAGNVGIGTSSPTAKLEVYDASSAVARVTAGTEIFEIRNTGSEVRLAVVSADPMTFRTSNVEAMRIDSSGNVGIGTSSPTEKLTIAGIGRVTGGNAFNASGPVQAGNLYYGWEMYNVDSSTNYLQGYNRSTNAWMNNVYTALSHQWHTSGTERMRIDSSGNVGIGTSSPAVKLDVNGITGWQGNTTGIAASVAGANAPVNGGGNLRVVSTTTQAADLGGSLTLGGSYHSGGLYIDFAEIAGRKSTSTSGDSAGYLSFGTRVGAGNITERMRIDPSGAVLIGTTSNSSYGTASLCLPTNGEISVASGSLRSRAIYGTTTSNGANQFIDANGYLYRSTSSLKYKTDVKNATHGLAEVMTLRPVTYKGKNDGETVFGGLIAEEVDSAGLTEFVQYANDGTPDSLAYGNMVSLCIKAIQEQQALIIGQQAMLASLTARITALETK